MNYSDNNNIKIASLKNDGNKKFDKIQIKTIFVVIWLMVSIIIIFVVCFVIYLICNIFKQCVI